MPVTMPGRRRMALVTLAALAGLTGCTGGSSAAGGKTASGGSARAARPAALLDSALSAMLASGSVHISASDGTSTLSQDAGADSARMIMTSGRERVTVLEVDGVGYIKGGEAALTRFMGFKQAMAGRMAGRWISFRPGESGGGASYQAMTADMTVADCVEPVQPAGPLTLTARTVVAGRAVIGVRGDAAPALGFPAGSTETVYVAATGRPLPVRMRVLNLGNGTVVTFTFSRWGERVHLTAPPDPVPVTSLPGGSAGGRATARGRASAGRNAA